jgi:hypothetical protein
MKIRNPPLRRGRGADPGSGGTAQGGPGSAHSGAARARGPIKGIGPGVPDRGGARFALPVVCTDHRSSPSEAIAVVLPANDGHPVKRVHYATEVNHETPKSSTEDGPETVFRGIQGGGTGSGGARASFIARTSRLPIRPACGCRGYTSPLRTSSASCSGPITVSHLSICKSISMSSVTGSTADSGSRSFLLACSTSACGMRRSG